MRQEVSPRHKRYRSELTTLSMIMELISNASELNKNSIIRMCNLSHVKATNRINILIKAGLLSEERDGLRTFYSITQDGREFYKELEHFKKTCDELRLIF